MAVINATFLLLTLLAIVLSAVTYSRLPIAIPQAIPVSMQPDSNNNEEQTLTNIILLLQDAINTQCI